jgi:ABC-2 type transport system ATP-binding protein
MDATLKQTMAAADALTVQNVSHRFGDYLALDDVSLSVPSGSFTVLLGLNGAGKSTLFSLITRLYDNTSGTIAILGHDVRREPTFALQRLGVVFQARTLDADLSLRQNLTYHAALHGLGPLEGRRRADAALELVGLQDRTGEKVRNLSGGQARRVEIARCMMHRPALLLLDEPTVGLDIGSRESVLSIVRELVANRNIGVLWATHLIDEIEESDAVAVLHQGKVLYTGTVPGLCQHAGADNTSDAFRNLTEAKPKTEAA